MCLQLLQDSWTPTASVMVILKTLRAALADPMIPLANGQQEWSGVAHTWQQLPAGQLPKKLYHYTNAEAKESIIREGKIRASEKGACGPGIYATCLHPANIRKEQMIRNTSAKGADWIVELDVFALLKEGWQVCKCNLGYSLAGGDHYLITKGPYLVPRSCGSLHRAIGKSEDIPLDHRWAFVTLFECFSSCVTNSRAADTFWQS